MVTDRAKIRNALSIVAISLALGFNAECSISGTPVVAPVAIESVADAETAKRIERRNGVEYMKLKTFGNVKQASLLRAKMLLQQHLSDRAKSLISEWDTLTVVEKGKAGQVAKDQLQLPSFEEGTIVPINGLHIVCAEDMVKQLMPAIADAINKYVEKA